MNNRGFLAAAIRRIAGGGRQNDAHIGCHVPFAQPGEHAIAAAPAEFVIEHKHRWLPVPQVRHAFETVHGRGDLVALLRQKPVENPAQLDIAFRNQHLGLHGVLRFRLGRDKHVSDYAPGAGGDSQEGGDSACRGNPDTD